MLLLVLSAILFAAAIVPPAEASQANPLAGLKLFVDRDSPSWRQWESYQRSGQIQKANLIWKIAREPRAVWLGRFTRPNFHVKVRRLIDSAVGDGAG